MQDIASLRFSPEDSSISIKPPRFSSDPCDIYLPSTTQQLPKRALAGTNHRQSHRGVTKHASIRLAVRWERSCYRLVSRYQMNYQRDPISPDSFVMLLYCTIRFRCGSAQLKQSLWSSMHCLYQFSPNPPRRVRF